MSTVSLEANFSCINLVLHMRKGRMKKSNGLSKFYIEVLEYKLKVSGFRIT